MIGNIISTFLFLSLILFIFIAKYTLDHCEADRRTSFVSLLASIYLVILGYIMEINSVSADGAYASIKVSIVGLQFIFPMFLLFIAVILEKKISRFIYAIVFIVPLINILLLWTTRSTGLVYTEFWFNQHTIIPSFSAQRGPLFPLLQIFPMVVALYCLVLMITQLNSVNKQLRTNTLLLLCAVSVPILANVFVILGLNVYGINYVPISMVFVGVLLYVNIIRHNLLDVMTLEDKLALKANQEAYERMMVMLDTSPVATQIWDKKKRTIDCNKAAASLFGFSTKQEYVDKFLEYCSPERQPDGRRSSEKALDLVNRAFKDGYCIFEWMHKMPSSNVDFPAEVTLVRTKYNNQDVVIGYTRDLRDHYKLLSTINKLTVDMLNYETDHFASTLIEAMEKIGQAVDADRVYLFKKETKDDTLYCTRLFDWSVEEQKRPDSGQTISVLFPKDWFKRLSNNECISGMTKNLPDYDRKHLQERNVVSMIIVPIFLDSELWGFLGVHDCRNEREFTMLEEAILRTASFLYSNGVMRNNSDKRLLKVTHEALAAAHAKSSFLANMSHEIRTPMNAILGITEIMLNVESLPQDVKDGLTQIYGSCDLLLGIINDILDFSKIESGKLDLNIAPYRIASLIIDSIQLNMMLISNKSIKFEVEVDENLPTQFVGDILRIKQILNNLLSNAFKYTEAGLVKLSVSFEPGFEDDTVNLIMAVSDTGYGMTQEQIKTVYVEYTRFSHAYDNSVEGTGLGLTITRGLLDAMNGDIYIDSEPGVGSVFTVSIPQKVYDSEVLGKNTAENLQMVQANFIEGWSGGQIVRHPMPYGRVLVVDDVKTNIYVAEGLLNLYSLTVDSVTSGSEAVGRIEAGEVYDIIFMDHMMPEMDGLEAAARIRKLNYPYPIVALTANAVAGQAEVFLQNGFDDFISKPINSRLLDVVLNKFIRSKHLRASSYDKAEVLVSGAFDDKSAAQVLELSRFCIDGLDMAKGMGLTGSSPETYLDLLNSFCDDACEKVQKIEESLKANNIRLYVTYTHAIKGAATYIGAGKVADAAFALEKAGNNNYLQFIEDNNNSFISTLLKLVDDIRGELSSHFDADNGVVFYDADALCAELTCLKDAIDNIDAPVINKSMDRLMVMQLPGDVKSGINKLSNSILTFDLDISAELIDSLLDNFC